MDGVQATVRGAGGALCFAFVFMISHDRPKTTSARSFRHNRERWLNYIAPFHEKI